MSSNSKHPPWILVHLLMVISAVAGTDLGMSCSVPRLLQKQRFPVFTLENMCVYNRERWLEDSLLSNGGRRHLCERHRRPGFRCSHRDHVWTLRSSEDPQRRKVHLHLGPGERVGHGRCVFWWILSVSVHCCVWCREVIQGTEPVVRFRYLETGNYTLRLEVEVNLEQYAPITRVYSKDVQVLGLYTLILTEKWFLKAYVDIFRYRCLCFSLIKISSYWKTDTML